MRLWSVPPLFLALLWAVASAGTIRAADEPGDRFLQVYDSYQAGAKLEAEGKYAEALQKFRYCVSLLQQIQRATPDYYPILIDSRLTKSRAAIARVESEQQTPSAVATDPAAFTPTSAPVSKPVASHFSLFPQNYRVPVSGQTPPPTPSHREIADTADQVMGRGAINALKEELDSLRRQVDEKNQTIEDLNRQLLESTAREQSGQKENDLRRVRDVEQESQLSQLRQTLDDLQQANGRLSREKESDQHQILSLQADLDAAHADLEVADEYNGELFAKLEQAAKFIDADEKIRVQLLNERKELSGRLEDKASDRTKVEKERDAAVAKRDELQKQLDDSEEAASKSRDLSKKLAAAEKQLADLSQDKGERQKVEAGLRDEVASANKTLAGLRDELKTGQKRIAELEKQLSDTAGASANVTVKWPTKMLC